MQKRVEFLVVDSGAFIKNSPVHEYANKIFTVSGAVSEIRDKATVERLQFLPYTLEIKEPSPEACKYVLDFSKKTGDYSSLSAVDMKIIALTYQLEKENVGTEHLNSEPSCQIGGKPKESNNQIGGFYIPKKDKTEETENPVNDNCVISSEPHSFPESDSLESAGNSCHENTSDYSGSDDDDNDEEGWLTPENIAEVREKMSGLKLDLNVTVACVTTDFSIQNVLIQMGLNVVSVDGMLIKQARVYILRCYSCYKTTNIITKVFCPNCGNKTLKRVAVTVNDDGTKNIHINFKRPINIRGTRFSLPTPKGGQHAVNPRVCEDQPVPKNRLSKKALQKVDVMDDGYVVRSSPFALNDVYSRGASLGLHVRGGDRHFLKRNPNQVGKCKGNRKK